jgi:hypothetical protein
MSESKGKLRKLPAPAESRLMLESDALWLPKHGRVAWDDVLGSVRLGMNRRERLYVLLRREGPAAPWIVVNARALRGSPFADLKQLAAAIDQRLAQAGYREVARPQGRQGAGDLLEGLLEDMDLRAFLPDHEVEIGDEWSIEPPVARRYPLLGARSNSFGI